MQVSAVNSVKPVSFQGRSADNFDEEVIRHLTEDEYDALGTDHDKDEFYASDKEDFIQAAAFAARNEAEAEARQDVSPLTVLGAAGGAAALFALVKGKILPLLENLFAKVGKPAATKVLKLLRKTPLLSDKVYNNALNAGKKVYAALTNTDADEKFIKKFNGDVDFIFKGNEKAREFLKAVREKLGINNKKNIIEAAIAGSVAYMGSDIVSDKAEDKIDNHKINAKVKNTVKNVLNAIEEAGAVS